MAGLAGVLPEHVPLHWIVPPDWPQALTLQAVPYPGGRTGAVAEQVPSHRYVPVPPQALRLHAWPVLLTQATVKEIVKLGAVAVLPALSVPVKVGMVLVSPEPVTVPVIVIVSGEPERVVNILSKRVEACEVKVWHPVPETSVHVILMLTEVSAGHVMEAELVGVTVVGLQFVPVAVIETVGGVRSVVQEAWTGKE